MKYLIAIDSDGTLRHSDGNISDKTKKIIKKVVDCGNIVVIKTYIVHIYQKRNAKKYMKKQKKLDLELCLYQKILNM